MGTVEMVLKKIEAILALRQDSSSQEKKENEIAIMEKCRKSSF